METRGVELVALQASRVTVGRGPDNDVPLGHALCRPLASRDVFSEPASLRDIAATLVVAEAAVKQHLLNLYGKFAIPAPGARRRVLLANEAIRRGAVNLAELPNPPR